jgi:hypothetical protein
VANPSRVAASFELRLERNWEIIIGLALRLKVISCRVAGLREQKRLRSGDMLNKTDRFRT